MSISAINSKQKNKIRHGEDEKTMSSCVTTTSSVPALSARSSPLNKKGKCVTFNKRVKVHNVTNYKKELSTRRRNLMWYSDSEMKKIESDFRREVFYHTYDPTPMKTSSRKSSSSLLSLLSASSSSTTSRLMLSYITRQLSTSKEKANKPHSSSAMKQGC